MRFDIPSLLARLDKMGEIEVEAAGFELNQ